jgi:hypothetical protein
VFCLFWQIGLVFLCMSANCANVIGRFSLISFIYYLVKQNNFKVHAHVF